MSLVIAYLGPEGTYAETVALAYERWLTAQGETVAALQPYPTINATLQAIAEAQADHAVVPVENSIHGSVAITLDVLWQLELPIRQALVLPIQHTLLSHALNLAAITTVYSHPQALAQCQGWLESHVPQAQLVATHSTTAVLRQLIQEPTAAAIASPRAAALYQVPTLATSLNDYPENYTRFWIVGREGVSQGNHVALAFSTPANRPGALVTPLQVFAQRGINLSRIESRPTKRLLGEYLFFIELEGSMTTAAVQEALAELPRYTEVLKIFGSYSIWPIRDGAIAAS